LSSVPETTNRIAIRPPHPGEEVLLRFLRGEVTRPERGAVVRHLLTGCRECEAVTRPVWSFADEPVVKPSGLRSVISERDAGQR
jgi:hypothetical protein